MNLGIKPMFFSRLQDMHLSFPVHSVTIK